MKKKNANGISGKQLLMISALAIIVVIASFQIKQRMERSDSASATANKGGAFVNTVVKDADIIISRKEITETPSFFPAKIDGVDLEVIAVKGSDGIIRTAFNTCQICYSSGKGYYKVEDKRLVCQSCGNHFGMDELGVAKGGCNPVPITDEYRAVDDETITISKDFLSQAIVIFQNWK